MRSLANSVLQMVSVLRHIAQYNTSTPNCASYLWEGLVVVDYDGIVQLLPHDHLPATAHTHTCAAITVE
jgi:hypothetical protein